jgi:hypothetical protein
MRTPLGEPTAVAFTSETRLTATLGLAQAWVRIGEAALRALVAPLGVSLLTVDPLLTAPAVRPAPSAPARPPVTRAPARPAVPLMAPAPKPVPAR